MTIKKATICGLSVDTWGEKILLEDDMAGTVVTLSDDDTEALIGQLRHAQTKVRQNKRKKI